MDIPNYTLIRKLGEGAMAQVWLGEHKRNKRQAAIKILKHDGASARADLERLFLREGEVLASINHRNVVTIYDNEKIGDCAFLVMELLPGGTLLERMQAGPIRVGEAIGFVVQIANALEAAHLRGIIHRDLKPANVMLRDATTPVLTDFGAVRLLHSTTLYGQDGGVIGTPAYMSPEQITARPLDGRSDLYALGVLFHELLTGRLPFEGQTLEEMGMLHLHAPPPRLPPRLAVLQPVLDQMLAKDPAARFADIGAFTLALRQCWLDEEALRLLVDFEPSSPWSGQLRALGFDFSLGQSAAVREAQQRFQRSAAAADDPLATRRMEATSTGPLVAGHGARAPQRALRRWAAALLGLAVAAAAGWGLHDLLGPTASVVPAVDVLQVEIHPAGTHFRDRFRDGHEGPWMVVLPAGDMLMGAVSHDPAAAAHELPAHPVHVGGFAIGRDEVSVAEFEQFVAATQYRTEAERGVGESGCWAPTDTQWQWHPERSWKQPGHAQSAEFPVVCVSFNDAHAYTEWLAEQTSAAYRLPNEAELEYAIRAGSDAIYPWGDEHQSGCAHANGSATGSTTTVPNDALPPRPPHTPSAKDCQDGQPGLAARGQFAANAFGLRDTLGNAWEWAQDCWNDSHAGAPAVAAARTDGNCNHRVMRGGSWSEYMVSLRSSHRFRAAVSDRMVNLGFRVVRDL